MNEILLGTVIDKVDAYEKKISGQEKQMNELKEKVTNMGNNSEILSIIKTEMEQILTAIQKQSFLEKGLRQLHLDIITNTELLKQPVKKEVIPHSYAAKAIWIAAALFLILCLMSAGWITTAGKLNMYKANDTKYRYLKLQDNETLNTWLSLTDSLHLMDATMRNTVIAKEDENQKNLEIMQKALKMEKEAKKLKQKVSESAKNR